jgi:magnesium chelatase family protein
VVRARVKIARKIQSQRLGSARTNSLMTSRELKEYVAPDDACKKLLQKVIGSLGLSARACDRLLKVSRTIADLAGLPKVEQEHLMEAINFRQLQF